MTNLSNNIKPLRKPLILVVDDKPSNLRKFGNALRNNNYDVAVSQDGKSALKIAKSVNPDLILLDLIMPDVDGYEVCEMLKKNQETKDIPVVFVSENKETENVIQSLQLGAVDYIMKDDSEAEMLARVKTHVNLKTYREQLRRNNKELIKLNDQLKRLNQEKDEFLGIAAHDLKNPINNISLIAKILSSSEELSSDDIHGFAEDITVSSEKMLELIKNLLDINAIEQGELKVNKATANIYELIEFNIFSFKTKAKAKNINLHFDSTDKEINVLTDSTLFMQVMDNLISNSIKYSEPGKSVFIRLSKINSNAVIRVIDEGPGFTDEDKRNIFKKFARLSAQPTAGEYSTGLGLSIVKKITEELNWSIELNSEPNKGAEFTVTIPNILRDEDAGI